MFDYRLVLNDAEHATMLALMKDNELAVNFICKVFFIQHIFDDLIDRDKVIPNETLKQLFWAVIVDLPNDPFYRANYALLHPVWATMAIDWFAANDLEVMGGDENLSISYVIRGGASLFTTCLLLVGGANWANEHAAPLWRFVNSEGFQLYKENLTIQFSKAEKNKL